MFGVLKKRRIAPRKEKQNTPIFGSFRFSGGVGNERKMEKFSEISVIFALRGVVGSRGRNTAAELTEEEYAEFSESVTLCKMSQAEFIRQALIKSSIRPVITVSPVNDELLSAVGKLTAEYGKIGGNLNQIARCLNEYGAPYNALSKEVRAATAELAALKFEVLQKVGEAVGNIQTYQL